MKLIDTGAPNRSSMILENLLDEDLVQAIKDIMRKGHERYGDDADLSAAFIYILGAMLVAEHNKQMREV